MMGAVHAGRDALAYAREPLLVPELADGVVAGHDANPTEATNELPAAARATRTALPEASSPPPLAARRLVGLPPADRLADPRRHPGALQANGDVPVARPPLGLAPAQRREVLQPAGRALAQ